MPKSNGGLVKPLSKLGQGGVVRLCLLYISQFVLVKLSHDSAFIVPSMMDVAEILI